MKITFEINGAQHVFEVPDSSYEQALRYTLDPCEHAVSLFDHWAQLAQQQNPGVDLTTLPTKAEQAAAQEKQRIKEIEAFQKSELERKDKESQAERERVAEQEARAAIEEERAAQNRKAEVAEQVRLALQDPELLKEMAQRQGMDLVLEKKSGAN
jgi:hypothetical protein